MESNKKISILFSLLLLLLSAVFIGFKGFETEALKSSVLSFVKGDKDTYNNSWNGRSEDEEGVVDDIELEEDEDENVADDEEENDVDDEDEEDDDVDEDENEERVKKEKKPKHYVRDSKIAERLGVELELNENAEVDFSDLLRNHKHYNAIEYLVKLDVADINLGTTILPPDIIEGAWYLPYVVFAIDNSLVDLDEDGNFNPDELLDRATGSEIVYRFFQLIAPEEEVSEEEVILEEESEIEEEPEIEEESQFEEDSEVEE
ncbi:hypothetical protein GF354_03155 [Candidatus Peregrinibacteria bacterium]|nr:hypothetical protein [Candidatus Peregrinibacteria bacterium]